MKIRYLFIVILIIVSYFIFSYFNIDDNKIKNDVIKQLNKKYQDKFYVSNYIKKDDSINFYRLYLFSEQYPNYEFYATCVIENHRCHVYDNYQRYIYNDEIKKYIDESLIGIYSDYKVFLDLDEDEVLDKKYSIVNDYLSSQTISITLFVSNLEYFNRKNNIEEVRQKLKKFKIMASITLIYIDKDALVNVDNNNYKTYTMTLDGVDSYSTFNMNKDYNFDYNVWSD